LVTNGTNAQYFNSTYQFNSFDTDGITVTDDAAGNYGFNGNNETYVSWNWKAGGTAVSNTDGTITSQVSANVDAGFSIVKYSGTSTSGATIGHGLNAVPEMVILKNLDSSTNWYVYHQDTGTTSGYINYLKLNDSSTGSYSDKVFYPVNFNSSTLTPGYDSVLQGNMISYCFHSVDGYSIIGSYDGGDTTSVKYTGFEPSWIMVKGYSNSGDWIILDNKRNTSNPRNKRLYPSSSTSEAINTNLNTNFVSNGFVTVGTDGDFNGSGRKYIFLAIA